MKLYALACCILALSAQAVRVDAFLPGPDKYENSFIHTAAFTPVGEHTTEWSKKVHTIRLMAGNETVTEGFKEGQIYDLNWTNFSTY